MYMKQKMGSITDSLPGSKKDETAPAKASASQIRKDLTAGRAERDAAAGPKKEKTSKISERWAANKKANS
jgi:hypothetical protein